MPDSFPFLHLPFVSQRLVFGTMPVIDILQFSSCSARTERLVKSLRIPMKSIQFHDCSTESAENYFRIFSNNKINGSEDFVRIFVMDEGTLRKTFVKTRSPVIWLCRNVQASYFTVRINTWWISNHHRLAVSTKAREVKIVMTKLMKHFAGLFLYEDVRLITIPKWLFFRKTWMWFSNIKKVNILSDKKELTEYQMKVILGDLNTRDLVIDCPVVPEFRYDPTKIIQFNHLFLNNPLWLTMQNFSSMDCAHLSISYNEAPKFPLVSELIWRWTRSELLENLQVLSVRTEQPFPNDYLENVFRLVHFYLNPNDVLGIRRSKDGRQATATCSRKLFTFVVN